MKTFDKITVAILMVVGLTLTFGIPGPLTVLSAHPEKSTQVSTYDNFLSKALLNNVPSCKN